MLCAGAGRAGSEGRGEMRVNLHAGGAGRTALMFAARRGYVETMRVLIVNGCADWELTTRDGKTAQRIAEDFNKLQVRRAAC